MSVRANFADTIYLRGMRRMRDRGMRSGTELAREIQQTDWSIACVAWQFKLFFEREWSGEAAKFAGETIGEASFPGSSRLWGLLSRFPGFGRKKCIGYKHQNNQQQNQEMAKWIAYKK